MKVNPETIDHWEPKKGVGLYNSQVTFIMNLQSEESAELDNS